MSLSIIADHDEMYFQHIDAVQLNEFKFDYMYWKELYSPIYTTNEKYFDSISFLPHNEIKHIYEYD